MNFYSELESNRDDDDRKYAVRTATGDMYEFKMRSADFKFDSEANLIIFTTILNYRIAINCQQIESIKWDIL